MMKASINSIESFGLVDGPGIRTVIFFNGCKLRCKYCHNPEMWKKSDENYTVSEIVEKVKRFKPYYRNNGGVTYSGGEPLLQIDFLIELSKELKKEGIHIALDTAGCGMGQYEELLKYIDLVILDIKHVDLIGFKEVTGQDKTESLKFIDAINKSNKNVWIRQVIIPDVNDNYEYVDRFYNFLKRIKNVEKVEFIPYHKLGSEKYITLNIFNPYKDKMEMDKEKCNELYNYFLNKGELYYGKNK